MCLRQFFLVAYFNDVNQDFLKEGITIGISWLIINLGLDLLILIPISRMSIGDYFIQIGLRYIVIPIMAIMVGYVLEQQELRKP